MRTQSLLSVWSCFSAKGAGEMEIFTCNTDGPKFRSILEKRLLKCAHKFWKKGQWWMLEDNAPTHKAKKTKKWMHDHGISLLDFPPYSPDLNPIENLWAHFKRRIETHNATTLDELTAAVKQEWANTPQEMFATLSESMITRCEAVIASQGYMTKY